MSEVVNDLIPVSIVFLDGSMRELSVYSWRLEAPFFMVDLGEPLRRMYFNWDRILSVSMPTPPAPPPSPAE